MMKKERNERIRYERKVEKTSFTELADKYGISIERVRQICQQKTQEEILAEVRKKFESKLQVDNFQKFSKEIEKLSIQNRSAETVEKRRLMVRYLRNTLGLSFLKISFLLRRDHTSIMNLYYS